MSNEISEDRIKRLGLAALAAGYTFSIRPNEHGIRVPCIVDSYAGWVQWSPEHDSGDAFDLASDANINIEHIGVTNEPPQAVGCWPSKYGNMTVSTHYNGDKRGAMRRSIFEAAVLLGQSIANKPAPSSQGYNEGQALDI
ncbi:hypothetical protein YA0089_18930 [Pseudomonas viridiflava]|uniref:hypothetical protein n=1 Tax=Pseudomonas viridiflava TaxID=33069 RepID=UPI0018E628A6|nr:hypothetical protein [Pseudomonas viridiflava]MBI6725682.1 hypothetical protein [Pseudomonas viridiflava]